MDGSGNAYVAGYTSSTDFPTVNTYDGSHNGVKDVFVAQSESSPETIPTLSEWGMLIMGLLMLASGRIAVIRRRKVALRNVVE